MAAILSLARDSFEEALIRLAAEVVAAEVRRPFGTPSPRAHSRDPFDETAAVAIGAVKPVIQTIVEAIGAVLLVAFVEPGVKRFMHIRFAVAVRVFCVKNFRRGADDDSFAPGHNPGREIHS